MIYIIIIYIIHIIYNHCGGWPEGKLTENYYSGVKVSETKRDCDCDICMVLVFLMVYTTICNLVWSVGTLE